MIKRITYKEKEYPVKAGYYALSQTQNELKKLGVELDMENILTGDISILEPLLYYSLKMGAHLEDKELILKRDDIPFVLDGCFTEFMIMLPEFFPKDEKLGEVKGVKKAPLKRK